MRRVGDKRSDEALDDVTAAIEAIPSLADDLKPPEHKVWLWLAVRAELLSRLARHDAAAPELGGLRRLIAASDAPDRDAVANELFAKVHRTAPDQVAAAWHARTGESWPPCPLDANPNSPVS